MVTYLLLLDAGFLVASDEGALTFYEKTDLREKIQEKEPYLHFKSFYAGDNNVRVNVFPCLWPSSYLLFSACVLDVPLSVWKQPCLCSQ